MMTSVSAVFLVGMPRSGTKLLRDLLNRHPRIAIPEAETEFLPWLDLWVQEHGEPAHRKDFDHLWQTVRQQQFFAYRAESGRPLDPDAWYSACQGATSAALFEALVRADTGTIGKDVIWGDKSPSYVDDIHLIHRLYPDACVIHLVRDVRDYCSSIRRAWGKNVLRAAQAWHEGVDAARQQGAVLTDRYIELRYEDLLADPEGQLRRICSRIGIDFQPAMLQLERATENLGRTQGAAHVVRGNAGRFREELSESELRAIERIAGATLRAFGYERLFPQEPHLPLSGLQRRKYQLLDAVNLMRFEQSQRGWIGALLFHWRRYRAVHGR